MIGNNIILDTNIISALLKGDSEIANKTENDIWIAAIARQYNLTLITRDKHFSEVEELTIVSC